MDVGFTSIVEVTLIEFQAMEIDVGLEGSRLGVGFVPHDCMFKHGCFMFLEENRIIVLGRDSRASHGVKRVLDVGHSIDSSN